MLKVKRGRERGGGCLAFPARLVRGELILLDGALGSVKGSRHSANRAPAKRTRDVLVELAHEHVRRQTRVAQLLGEEAVRGGPSSLCVVL